MAQKITPPSIDKTAFDCPHCGAFTTQYWFEAFATRLDYKNIDTPFIPRESYKESILADDTLDSQARRYLLDAYDKINRGLPFFR